MVEVKSCYYTSILLLYKHPTTIVKSYENSKILLLYKASYYYTSILLLYFIIFYLFYILFYYFTYYFNYFIIFLLIFPIKMRKLINSPHFYPQMRGVIFCRLPNYRGLFFTPLARVWGWGLLSTG